MKPAVVWLLILRLILGPTLVTDIKLQIAIQNFRSMNIDYPKVDYPRHFFGYCNGLMAYVRGKMQEWYCPSVHYVVHAPWRSIRKLCQRSEGFCENYNEYCTLTDSTFPLTICRLNRQQPPTSCRYWSSQTNQRLYLLCSAKFAAYPIGIIGVH